MREAVNTIEAVLKRPINITAPLIPLSDVAGLCFTVILAVVVDEAVEEDDTEADVPEGDVLCAPETVAADVAEAAGDVEAGAAVVAEADVAVVVTGAVVS